MEQPEVPIEQVQEHIEHHAHHGGHEGGSGGNLSALIAVSTAILAAFAAVASLLAGHNANEAMLSQIQSSDQWAFYQAKSIKASILKTKIALLEAQGHAPTEADKKKADEYEAEQKEIKEKAEALHHTSEAHLHLHEKLAASVTLLQVSITIAAIAALTKKRAIWIVSLLIGLGGIAVFVQGLIGASSHH